MKQILAVEKDPADVDNPITQAVKLRALDQSTDPEEKRDAQIIGMLQDLMKRVDQLDLARSENPYYRDDWESRTLTTNQDIHKFLNKFPEYRDLSAGERDYVRKNCADQAHDVGYLSRNEAAAILNTHLARLGTNRAKDVVLEAEVLGGTNTQDRD
ncbi:MAG: hypothetical protein H0U10_01315 [Chloroflexia bacterium]|nr:hypothetical protein [Chloroflexia bacterium]